MARNGDKRSLWKRGGKRGSWVREEQRLEIEVSSKVHLYPGSKLFGVPGFGNGVLDVLTESVTPDLGFGRGEENHRDS